MQDPVQVNAETGVAERIRLVMAHRRMSIRALSDATELPYRTVQSYLLGKHALPASAVAKIAKALKISADYLLLDRAWLHNIVLVRECLDFLDGLGATTLRERADAFVDFYEKVFFADLNPDSDTIAALRTRTAELARRPRGKRRKAAR